MIDFLSLPSRSFARVALVLMACGVTVGTSIGVQSILSKGRAEVVPAPPTPDLPSELINNQDNSTPDVSPPDRSDNEPVVEGWPSLLYPSSSTPEPVLDNSAIEEMDAEGMDAEGMDADDDLPQSLAMMIRRIDRAASNENINGVMRFYSDDLQHSDGITQKEFKSMLIEFWDTYENLNYSTEVSDWQVTDTGFITTTLTTVTGQKNFGAQLLSFEAMLESRQVIRDRHIIEQEILAESSQIHLGQAPPTVNVNLPNTVRPGETFYFDAIVLEPIGDSLLMGTAFSDPVSLETYRTVPSLDVGVLGAGGLFKEGNAPSEPGQEWVSGLVFREDGITGVTQRLRIVGDR